MMPTTVATAADRRLKFHGFALKFAVAALGLLTLLLFSSVVVSLIAQEPQREPRRDVIPQRPIDLPAIKPDLVAPVSKDAPPAPGLRVKQQLPPKLRGSNSPGSSLLVARTGGR